MENPEEALIRNGIFVRRSCPGRHTVTVAKIDMDALHTLLSDSLMKIFKFHEALRSQFCDYSSDEEDEMPNVNVCIGNAVSQYCHQALNELWNRLRNIAESYSYYSDLDIFDSEAPADYDFAFPQFYAKLLSSIGPLHVSDILCDGIIIYVPDKSKPYFGRSENPNIDDYLVCKFQKALSKIGIPLGKIQLWPYANGSFFTTCGRVSVGPSRFNIIGSFQPSNYTRDDIIMAMLFGNFGADDNPFEDLSISVGFVDDEATVKAFLSSRDPQQTDGESRHVGGTYAVGKFGVAPASNVPVAGRGQGIYVIGRGSTRHYTTCLAHGILKYEMEEILRHRILH